jgi:hypothetical protein
MAVQQALEGAVDVQGLLVGESGASEEVEGVLERPQRAERPQGQGRGEGAGDQ